MDKQFYEVLYYNEVFKDWMRLGHWLFNNNEDAQKYISHHALMHPEMQFKITEYEKPRRARTKSVARKATVRQERVN